MSLKTVSNAPINVNPIAGVGGVQARGGDLIAKSIPSVGGLIEYLCSGVRMFDLFSRETGVKIKCGYLASSLLALLLLYADHTVIMFFDNEKPSFL